MIVGSPGGRSRPPTPARPTRVELGLVVQDEVAARQRAVEQQHARDRLPARRDGDVRRRPGLEADVQRAVDRPEAVRERGRDLRRRLPVVAALLVADPQRAGMAAPLEPAHEVGDDAMPAAAAPKRRDHDRDAEHRGPRRVGRARSQWRGAAPVVLEQARGCGHRERRPDAPEQRARRRAQPAHGPSSRRSMPGASRRRGQVSARAQRWSRTRLAHARSGCARSRATSRACWAYSLRSWTCDA